MIFRADNNAILRAWRVRVRALLVEMLLTKSTSHRKLQLRVERSGTSVRESLQLHFKNRMLLIKACDSITQGYYIYKIMIVPWSREASSLIKIYAISKIDSTV